MKIKEFTIFVVDDSPVALDIITRAIRQTIYCNVKGFTSAEDCLYGMENGLPDLILSDYYLDALYERKINGDQMLSRIKKAYPGIPVIMYSSQNSIDVMLRLMKLGAVDFIPKEKDFLKTISSITNSQINKIKKDYENSWITRVVLFMIAAFTGLIIIVHIYSPDSVIYTIIGIMLFLCIVVFVTSKKATSHRSYGDLN